MTQKKKLLRFPCIFPLKVMGLASAEFEGAVIQIVRAHAPDLGEGAVKIKHSKENKYESLTITILAQDQAQLDAIYHDLAACEHVIMTL